MDVNLDEYRAQVFGTQSPTHSQQEPAPALEAPDPALENNPEPAAAEPDKPEISAGLPSSEVVAPTIDYVSYLKANFDYEDAEKLKADLKAFKEKSQTPAEIAFANEESKKIHHFLREGKNKEVKAYLDAQDLLSNVDGMSSEQQLKLYIKMQNPLFDQELIEDEFKSLYSVNEESFEDDPLKLRKEKVKAQQRASTDVEKAKEFFSQYRTKIELPDISPKAEATKDEDYEAWKAQSASMQEIGVQRAEAYKKLSPKQAASTFKFNDEASKLAFDVVYEPDAESFGKTVSSLSDPEKLVALYTAQDGSLDQARLAKDFYNGQNVEKLVNTAIVQAVNQTKAWFLKNQKNIGDGVQRNFTIPPQTDVEKLRQQVFGN